MDLMKPEGSSVSITSTKSPSSRVSSLGPFAEYFSEATNISPKFYNLTRKELVVNQKVQGKHKEERAKSEGVVDQTALGV